MKLNYLVISAALAGLTANMAFGQQTGNPASSPTTAGKYTDPVLHKAITQPYQVVQDLEELTARIDNLYRKPFNKLFDKNGCMQPETFYFKDTTSGHEIVGLTRELCADMAHGDLGRPAWTCDGRNILFMGNRAYVDVDGLVKATEWPGHKYIMDADYANQRALMVTYKDKNVDKKGETIKRSAGIYSKYNIMDPDDPRYSYYAVGDKLWRVTISDDPSKDSVAELFCTMSNPQTKIIQDISKDRKLLIQDANADPDRKTGVLPYMPEIHLIDLTKKQGDKGFYSHHPFDYGLPEVKGQDGKVLHDAKNNYQFHSISFGKVPNTICWGYGPMTSVGEFLGWSLDITNGLDGTPTHGTITSGGGGNKWGQYESHGKGIGGCTLGLFFSGPPKGADGKVIGSGEWGIYIRDYEDENFTPRFLIKAPGGHVAGGNSRNPDVWAAHVATEWRNRGVKESDAIVWGHTSKTDAGVLCNTFSDLRGGIKRDKTWTGMNSTDARPYSSIPRPLLSPDGTKLWYHSAMLMPYDQWNGMYVCVTDRPQAPQNLKLADNAKTVELVWQSAKMANETKGYHVYRGDADGKNFVELTTAALADKTFTDKTAEAGKTYTYAVTAEEWSTLESDTTSNTLKVAVSADGAKGESGQPVKGWDKTPPPAVTGFTVTKEADEDGQYRLKWAKNPATDLRYYNVYFSTKGKPEISQKRLIVSPLAGMTEYLDWSAPLAAGTVYYAITAVDRQGNESAPAYFELTNK